MKLCCCRDLLFACFSYYRFLSGSSIYCHLAYRFQVQGTVRHVVMYEYPMRKWCGFLTHTLLLLVQTSQISSTCECIRCGETPGLHCICEQANAENLLSYLSRDPLYVKGVTDNNVEWNIERLYKKMVICLYFVRPFNICKAMVSDVLSLSSMRCHLYDVVLEEQVKGCRCQQHQHQHNAKAAQLWGFKASMAKTKKEIVLP